MKFSRTFIFVLMVSIALLSCESLPEETTQAHWADVTLTQIGFGAIQTWAPEERMRGIQLAKADAAQKMQEKIPKDNKISTY